MKQITLKDILSKYQAAQTDYNQTVENWKGLGEAIKAQEKRIAELTAEYATAAAALHKPLDFYTRKWTGSGRNWRREIVNPEARHVEALQTSIEYAEGALAQLKIEQAKTLPDYTAIEWQRLECETANLINAAGIAAARLGKVNPLQGMNDLPFEVLPQAALDELAAAEIENLAAKKEKRRKVPKAESDVVQVKCLVDRDEALILPEVLNAALKGVKKSGMVLINNWILLPAATIADWARIVAGDSDLLALEFIERTATLRIKVNRTVAEFKGIHGDDWQVYENQGKLSRRVEFEAA